MSDFAHSEDGTGRKPISDKTMTHAEFKAQLEARQKPRAEYSLNNPQFFEPEHKDDWYDYLPGEAVLVTCVCVAALLTLAGIWAILEAFA